MDKLTIINVAQMKCGLPLSAALNDCDWNAALVFDNCTHEVLRSFCWGFAQEFRVLALSGKPEFGFEKEYNLPVDCVRVVDVHGCNDLRSPKGRYTLKGKVLRTQLMPCYLRYVTNTVPCEDWPPDFTDAVASRIAMEIAPLSAQSMQLVPMLTQKYLTSLANAQATDGRENMERVPHDIDIWGARGGYERVGARRE